MPRTLLRSSAVLGVLALFVGAIVGSVAGCAAPAPSSRDAVVHEALARDNRDLALRDPREVAARFSRMADNPFDFLRGSIGLWARDVATPGSAGNVASAFADDVAAGILLVGDPHPENFGTSRIAGGLLFGFNDFDVARFGPAVLDLRRLALGFVVANDTLGTAITDDVIVDAVVAGYADVMGGDTIDVIDDDNVLGDAHGYGVVVEALCLRARSKGAARAERDDLTTIDADGTLHLKLTSDVPDDLEAEVLLDVADHDADVIHDALFAGGVLSHELGRAVGRGVGSRPLLRHVVLIDDTAAVDAFARSGDGIALAQLKEARDSFVLPGYAAEHERFFADNADRVVFARRHLLGHDGADDLLRAVPLSPLGAVLTRETAWAQTVRLSRLRDGLADHSIIDDDIVVFARLAGQVLASTHRRSIDVDGNAVDARLVASLALNDERTQQLQTETRDAVAALVDDARTDHERLQRLLAIHGPTLGLEGFAK